MRKIIITFAIICGLLIPSYAFAQNATSSITPSQTPREKRVEARDTMKANLAEAREAFQERVEAAKEEFRQKREEFKEKLEQIRDERKKALVERIDQKIETFNTRHTEHMMKALERLESILANLVTKTNEAKAAGFDTKSAETAITEAEASLAAAKAAVEAQAVKDYTTTITTESALRTMVGSEVSQFRIDIKSTHQKVLAAKAAVKKVHLEYVKIKGLRGVGRNPGDGSATPSGKTTLTPTRNPSATPTIPVATSTPSAQ